ncbi:hypothetical protein LQ318_13935 [Aliifodinibius salicampi]|uniref:Outer membrane protein beta-barrel domain-containing protein n=1 Tax=Fodinibius salicampi TaxID=1920655 RepID=A0ABT3Q1N2_9BACT|nr:hypothetical protein [Fodinibius salicampi]MCW9714007.1 hypothetical protein [Fodinibius salicampi]
MKKAVIVLLLFFSFSTISFAQITYKSDPGFFTPVLKSFYLRGGSFENTQLIGPAIGYRINESHDFTLHTEYLSSDLGSEGKNTPKYSGINVGFILGNSSADFAENWLIRSKLSVYKSFNFNATGYSDRNLKDPKLFSGQGSTAIYIRLPVSTSISLLPNAGGFLGYGDYSPTQASAHFRQGIDGFQVGPQFGLDLLFKFSRNFYLALKPQYHIQYNLTHDTSGGILFFNTQFNF